MNKPIGPSELGFRIARRLSKEFGGGHELPTSMLHLIANVVDHEIASYEQQTNRPIHARTGPEPESLAEL